MCPKNAGNKIYYWGGTSARIKIKIILYFWIL
jgi:hypothetical protein